MAEDERREASLRDQNENLQISHPIIEGPQSQSLEGLQAVNNLSVEENERVTHSHLFGGSKPE